MCHFSFPHDGFETGIESNERMIPAVVDHDVVMFMGVTEKSAVVSNAHQRFVYCTEWTTARQMYSCFRCDFSISKTIFCFILGHGPKPNYHDQIENSSFMKI